MAPKKNPAENLTAAKENGKTEKISKTKRAGLTMPVSRFQRYLKKGRYANRISVGASVYMAAVVEYLVAEIAELSGNAAKANKKRTINPRYIMLGIRNDEELNRLLEHVTIAGAGVIPAIHPALIPKKSAEEMTPQIKVSQEY